MKRIIFVSTVLLALLVIVLLGDRIAGRILDAELGPLLTRQLKLPVEIAPMKARLFQLEVHSEKLVMGDADSPAVLATGVAVALSWPDLLRGEIRLSSASATDLMVRPARWPSSDSPAPTNYDFLDPWLPGDLFLDAGKYVFEGGDSYPVGKFHWQRQSSASASVTWSEAREAGTLDLQAKLKSLPDLLTLSPIALDLTLAVQDKPDSEISLSTTIQPGSSSAYTLEGDLSAAGMNAHIVATGSTRWSLPDKSTINIPLLKPKQVLALSDEYSATGADDDTAAKLALTLPRLNLPVHQSRVVIKEIRLDDEVARDATLNIASSEKGLQVTDLTLNGPLGILTGELGIFSNEQGWSANANAELTAREGQGNLAANFVGADWLWQSGQTTLKGKGTTWGSLLNSLHGDLSLTGEHRGKASTPISVQAELDNRPGEFALNQMNIKLGEGHISGSAVLSGEKRRKLTTVLQGETVHLNFMFEEEDPDALVGVALPEYLGLLPGIDLDATLDVNDLEVPGLSLATSKAKLERNDNGGKLVASATGKHYGTLELTLAAKTPPDQPDDFTLNAQFAELDLPEMFKQQVRFFSRTSGKMHFESRGEGMEEIFSKMQGQTDLTVEVRPDNNWQRTSEAHEKLALSGESSFVLDKDRIVGIKIDKLDIDSVQQELTGELSLVAGRQPWLIANLKSDHLDVTALLELLPESVEGADQRDLLESLRTLGAVQVSLDATELILREVPLSDVKLEIESGSDVFTLKQFDFTAHGGQLKSHGDIAWKKEQAKFEANATVSNLSLDEFLIHSATDKHIPVSGSANLLSEGSKVEELLGNLTGYIDLEASTPQTSDNLQGRRKLEMKATRLPDGVQADIATLQWGESELTGSLRYQRTTPATIDIKLAGGKVSLIPWENAALDADKEKAKTPSGSAVGSAARTSARFVGDVMLTPFRFLGADDEPKPGERIFSTDPLPLDSLNNYNLRLSGHLDSLESTRLNAKDLSITGSLANGVLDVTTSSGDLSGGTVDISITLDANPAPPTLKLDSKFEQVRGFTSADSYPRSGMLSMTSQGTSQAEFAAGINGLVYLELGKGPFDYANSALLTANLASSVFSTLIPGIEKQKPQIDCGVTVALFQDGLGATPYGFAARTDQANLLGHVQLDLVNETMQMSLDSRGRHGIGLSVGSVFSNTVQIRGPLNDPEIVPDATSLIWRGWAAFMTGGLSVLGESLYKRVLASDNPCKSTKELIHKDLCQKDPLAAASAMVCPKT